MEKKIVHIMRSNGVSGAENHVFMLLPFLKAFYDVSYIHISDLTQEMYPPMLKKALEILKGKGIKIYHVKSSGKGDLLKAFQVANLIRKIGPDLVHTHMPYSDLVGGLAGRLTGVPLIINSRHHDYSVSEREKNRFVRTYRVANTFSNHTIAISGRVADLIRNYEGMSEGRLSTILYGCNDQQVIKSEAQVRIRKELKTPEGSLLVGTVARLIDWKGHRFAIQAMQKLQNDGVPFHWFFAGDGPERSDLEDLAAQSGIKHLTFLGNRDDIPDLMAAMDVLVHPTLGEGFGLIFLEAMTQSTPIVATRTGAIPEIVEDGGNGYVIPVQSAEAIADKIKLLAQDRPMMIRMGGRSRQIYEERFTFNRMGSEILSLYKRLIR